MVKFPLIRKTWFYCLSVFFYVVSCSKEALPIATAEDEISINKYKIESLVYFLGESDRIDTLISVLDTIDFKNTSNTTTKIKHVDTFSNLLKTSVFQLDSMNVKWPHDLDLTQFKVSIPEDYYPDGTFGLYSDRFPISDTLVNELYKYDNKFSLDLTLPPYSKLIVTKSIHQYNLTCSFQLVIRNATTGELITLKGKWKGNLRYNNEHVSVKEISDH